MFLSTSITVSSTCTHTCACRFPLLVHIHVLTNFLYLYTYMCLQISSSARAAEAGDCSCTKTYHHKTNPGWNPRAGRGRCQGCQALGWWGCRCQCHWSKTTSVICTGLPVHIFSPGIDKMIVWNCAWIILWDFYDALFIVQEVNLAYENVKEVDGLDVSKEGSDSWEAAIKRWKSQTRPFKHILIYYTSGPSMLLG